jgi:hypothetical protein
MARAIVQKPILDTLIRAKLANIPGCTVVEPLPVVWKASSMDGCNWTVPGWVGDGEAVRNCTRQLAQYLQLLQAQFNIPEETRGQPH